MRQVPKSPRSGQADLEALTRDLDREFVADKFGSLSAADRRTWKQAKRKRGRPRVGAGSKVVSISIERGLLARADRLAKKLGTSRARLVAMGLEQMLSKPRRATGRRKDAA